MATQAADLVGVRPRVLWRPALAALGLSLVAVLGLYGTTVLSMVDIWWRSETFAHGFLIVPISLYLIWQRRATVLRNRPIPSAWGLALVLVAALAWAAAARIDVLLGTQLALVTLVIGVVLGVLGTGVVRSMLFPLGYLFFAVPMGDALIPPLRDFTARFSVMILQFAHMPVLLEGRYISIPTGTFEVAEACSGLRYLIASVVLGTVYAYLAYRSAWRRLLFIAFAVVVPIIANAVRAAGIVALAYASDMHLATGVDHIIYGWIFFGLVMFALFWAGQFLREPDAAPEEAAAARAAPTEPGTDSASAWKIYAIALLLVVGAGAGPGMLHWLGVRAAAVVEPARMSAPAGRGPWQGPFKTQDDWRPVFPGASGRFLRVYRDGAESVYLYSAYYERQRQGAELIKWGNRVYDGQVWVRVASGVREVKLASGQRLRVRETVIRSGPTDRVVWSWYRIGDRVTASALDAKLLAAWEDLRHGGAVAAVVAVAADYQLGPQQARDVLRRFLEDMGRVAPVAARVSHPPTAGARP